VLETIALQARSITNAEYAAVGIGNDPGVPFQPWVAVGIPATVAAAIGRTPRAVGVLGVVATEGIVLRIDDASKHSSHQGFPANHPRMTSFLGVPIRYRGRAVGNLYLADKRGGQPFTAHDEGLVEMLAARTAAAIETARLYHAEGIGHEWLKAVVDQMPEGVVLTDADGRLLPNRRAAIQLGEPPEFDLRLPSGEIVRPEDLPNVRAFRDENVTSGREYLLRQPDESFIPVLISAAPIRNRGAVVGATMIIEDISAMKEVERLREEWSSIIAHDLKQPVNTIALAAQLLSKSNLARSELARPVRHIRTAVSRLTRMIDDLLDASRLEARRLTVEARDLELAPFVDEVVERMAALGGRVVRNVPSGVRVWADPRRLEQVFVNLLSNADKYGDPTMPIRIDVREADGAIEIAVANRGPGIPAEEIPVLFSRFTRARAAMQGKVAGLGLGLYICKGLVQAHGGRIWAESEPGGTTRFVFTLSRPEAREPLRADLRPTDPGRARRRRRQAPRP
jgi:PAS domain S-box-containing protein